MPQTVKRALCLSTSGSFVITNQLKFLKLLPKGVPALSRGSLDTKSGRGFVLRLSPKGRPSIAGGRSKDLLPTYSGFHRSLGYRAALTSSRRVTGVV